MSTLDEEAATNSGLTAMMGESLTELVPGRRVDTMYDCSGSCAGGSVATMALFNSFPSETLYI
jgi:hypothetical protein